MFYRFKAKDYFSVTMLYRHMHARADSETALRRGSQPHCLCHPASSQVLHTVITAMTALIKCLTALLVSINSLEGEHKEAYREGRGRGGARPLPLSPKRNRINIAQL